MSMQDPISDMLTRVRNAQMAGKKFVDMPGSKLKAAVAQVLQDEGYIAGHHVDAGEGKPRLSIELKYYNGKPVIAEIERFSKPSLRQVPLNSSKITSSIFDPVSVKAVAIIDREPPPSMFLAAPKNLFGL